MERHKLPLVAGMVMALAGLVLAGSAAIVQARRGEPETPLPVYYDVPAFTLTDSNGRPFGREQLEGKVWVADFIFTTCAGPCPIMTARMSSLYRQFQGDDRVRFVSVTVDPENDTPTVMAAYAANLGADTGQWHFLTGPDEAIQSLGREGLKLGSGETPLIHDVHFVLVDARGRIRGYYDGTDTAEVDRLAQDLSTLLDTEP